MKVIHASRKEKVFKLSPETPEDLWVISNVICPGDKVKAKTLRTVKIGEKESKKPVVVVLSVEEVSFSEHYNRLRIHGRIVSGFPEEFVQLGRYHTIEVRLGNVIEVLKSEWNIAQENMVFKARDESLKPKILVVVVDEEKAVVAKVSEKVMIDGEVYSGLSKKDERYSSIRGKFLSDIVKLISEFDGPKLVAGPGFTADDVVKLAKDKGVPDVFSGKCSYAEINGVYELLKKGDIDKIVGKTRHKLEQEFLDRFSSELGKSGFVAYGIDEVENAVELGAVETLAVIDTLMRSDERVRKLMDKALKSSSKLLVFKERSDTGKVLSGLSGIAAILRFKIR